MIDIFSPQMVVAAAVVTVISATVNTGMFKYVNESVQKNQTAIAVHTEQIQQVREIQIDIKKYTKFLYDQEMKRQGKDGDG